MLVMYTMSNTSISLHPSKSGLYWARKQKALILPSRTQSFSYEQASSHISWLKAFSCKPLYLDTLKHVLRNVPVSKFGSRAYTRWKWLM